VSSTQVSPPSETPHALSPLTALGLRIESRRATVAVVGLGYVGLPLLVAAGAEGFGVIGVDVDPAKIRSLRDRRSYVGDVSDEELTGLAQVQFSTDHRVLVAADVIVIAVPTPLRDGGPDLSMVRTAAEHVAQVLRPGQLVVLESTTYPGTTEDLVQPILETGDLVAGFDFALAYSPERIDPGNEEFDFRSIPRIVGGLTPESTGVAALFYGQLVDKVVAVNSCRAAELAKLLENTFRHVNIALVNELAMICHQMGIDTWEVLDAAATKPFGYMPFQPGPGVGGNCIPVDPTYLAWQVRRDAGSRFRMLEEAQEINDLMPTYVAGRIGEALNDVGKAVRGARVHVLGVAYKPEVGEARESPAIKVMAQLDRRGAKVSFSDPYVEAVDVNGRGVVRTDLTLRSVSAADCVAVLTPHRAFDLDWIAERAPLIFDARNAYGSAKRDNVVPL
jgi:UDP-N-acetyl-D-glucosamine dehydrogenase